jgi:RNA polymerase sigma-70 factor (ECF subfamily)
MGRMQAAATAIMTATGPALDASAVYSAHADFVWASLQRLGVRPHDLDDVLQEVFVIVHQRLHTFDHSSKLTTWLFGVCLRAASDYRRRAYRRREQVGDEAVEEPATAEASTPEDAAVGQQSRARLDRILEELDLEKRAVFVMFEVEELSCDEIAAIVGAPVGTVHSRLHAARKQFEKAVGRQMARDEHGAKR